MGNIFTEIGKVLASFKLKKLYQEIEKEMAEDPSILATVESIKYHNAQLEKLMPGFCKRHPESSLCKEKGK